MDGMRGVWLVMLLLHSFAACGAAASAMDQVLGPGYALGELLLGDDWERVKASLGRISEEVESILGVLGDPGPQLSQQSAEGGALDSLGSICDLHRDFRAESPSVQRQKMRSKLPLQVALSFRLLGRLAISLRRSLDASIMQDVVLSNLAGQASDSMRITQGPQGPISTESTATRASLTKSESSEKPVPTEPPSATILFASEMWVLWWGRFCHVGEKIMWLSVFILDLSVVISMMLFMESIGGKPSHKSRALSKRHAKERERKAAGAAAASASPGSPIPAPTSSAGRESSQWLAWLSQEELLAALLKEHWFKFAVGLGLALAVRLLQRIMSKETLTYHLIVNVTMTLRFVGLALVLMRDTMLSPNPEEVAREAVNVLAERGVSSR